MLPAASVIFYGVWKYFMLAYQTGEVSGESAWNPVIWPFRTSFVIGYGLIILQTIAEVLKCILVLMGHDVPRPEVEE